MHAALAAIGIEPRIGFLFSVFDGPGARELSIFYRGEMHAPSALPATARLFAYDDIPWQQLPSDADRSKLRRYVEERWRYCFGIYAGNADAGEVGHLL